MPVPMSAVQFEKTGFRVTPEWTARSKRMIIYCRPAGAEPWSAEALVAANDQQLKNSYSGLAFGSTTQSFTFSPGKQFSGQWIDLYCCELGRENQLIANERVGRFFYGKCLVSYAVKTYEVSARTQAVRIQITNQSSFDLVESGIGYSVNGRRHPIPLAVRRGETVTLPQFETAIGARIEIRDIEGGYPVEAREKTGKE